MEIVTLTLILLVLLLLYIGTKAADSLNSIPGPFRTPIFGNLQFNFPKLHLQFTEFAKTYGEIFRIQILSQPVIVINSYNSFKEVYVDKGKDFLGRPKMLRLEVIGANHGMGFRDFSPRHTELRSKAIKAIGLQGMTRLDSLVNENLMELVQLFRDKKCQAFDPKVIIKKYLINIIFGLLFGEKVDYEDPIVEKVMAFNNAAVEAASIGREDIDVWPWTKYFNPNYKLAVKAREEFCNSIEPLYRNYKDTYSHSHHRGVIDQYIEETLNGLMTDEEVLGCLIDFFVGGVETTATTLYGFLLILLREPAIQKRLQQKIDDVIGKDRCPSHSDKASLPYVEACVLELLRYQSAMPILFPRYATQDTEVCGYAIPKGTWLFTNSWAIHRDEEIYPEANSYKPERFLDSNGGLLSQSHISRKSLVTFGTGKRHCIGETLAKTRLFLSACMLMQNFTFIPDESHPPPSCDPRDYNLKIIFDVNPYVLKAIPRE